MSATFEIKINAIRTGSIDSLSDVIREVDFTVKGTEAGQSFELTQTINLTDPETAASFIPLAQVTEAQVVQWITDTFTNMEAVKAHIQFVLDKEVAKAALSSSPLPWAPVEDTSA